MARAPGVGAGRFDGATLEALNAAEQALFALSLVPAAGLVDDAPRPTPVRPRPEEPLYLTARPVDGQVRLVSLGRMAATALMLLERPTPQVQARERVAAEGLGTERAGGLLAGLTQEGLLQAR